MGGGAHELLLESLQALSLLNIAKEDTGKLPLEGLEMMHGHVDMEATVPGGRQLKFKRKGRVGADLFPKFLPKGRVHLRRNGKDIAPAERRPVVVCQHGLEGRPQDLADPRKDHPAYHGFANRLALNDLRRQLADARAPSLGVVVADASLPAAARYARYAGYVQNGSYGAPSRNGKRDSKSPSRRTSV